MQIIRDRFREKMVWYDKPGEADAALHNYLYGNWAALTCEEVAFWRDCFEDPLGIRWEAAHAGVMSEEVDPLDFYGLVFIYDLGRTYEEGVDILLDMVGPHPITPITIWQLNIDLASKFRTKR